MGLPLKLSVERDGTTYTYDDSRLSAKSIDTQRRVDGIEVQLESMQVSIIRGEGSSDTEFAGYKDPLSVPPGQRYRAKLERTDTSKVLFNGAVVTDDIEYDKTEDSWLITLIDEANKEFWAALETTYWGEIKQNNITDRAFLAWNRYDSDESFSTPDDLNFDKDDPEFRRTTEVGYQLRDTIVEIFEQMGFSYDVPGQLFAESDGTFSDNVNEEDVFIIISRWRLATVIRQLCLYAGFRVIPQYTSFPSTDIFVKLAPTTFAITSTSADEGLASGEYRVRTRDQEFEALRMENEVAEPSPDPMEYQLLDAVEQGNFDTSIDEAFPTFAQAPAWALHGSSAWKADPPFRPSNTQARGDSRTFREDVEKLKLRIPPIDIKNNQFQQWEGRALIDGGFFNGYLGYKPDDDIRPPESEKAYIVREGTFVDSKNAYYALWGEVDANVNGSARADHWVKRVFNQQPQRREVQRELRGQFIGVESYEVGTRDGLEVEGSDWVVHEDRRTIGADRQQLQLRKPATDTEFVVPEVTPPEGNTVSGTWNVIRLRGRIVTIDHGDGKEDWLLAHWERTATENCREYEYTVEYEDENGDSQSIQVFTTAFSYQLASAGNGGQSYSNGRDVTVSPVGDGVSGVEETTTAERA